MYLLLRLICLTPVLAAGCSSVQSDESVLLFPTPGWPADDGKGWEIEIHGWVFEHDVPQALLERVIGEVDAVELEPRARPALVARRVRPFLVDNQGGKRMKVRVAGETETLGPTPENGHFTKTIRRSAEQIAGALGRDASAGPASPAWIGISVVPPPGDAREFAGRVLLLPAEGLSVISDVDDTIMRTGLFKDTEATLRNVLLLPYEPIDGMAAVYRRWAERHDAAFHYVSNSPWPRYEALAEFIAEHGFPAGTFQLRPFRLSEQGLEGLFNPSRDHKPEQVERILERLPRRRFVLVGDSGEHDPEVYGQAARKRPQQVVAILIRNVTDAPADAERYRKAFEGVPRSRWRVFEKPEEIADAVK